MGKRIVRKYDKKDKARIVKELMEGVTIKRLKKKYGVPASTLRGWRTLARKNMFIPIEIPIETVSPVQQKNDSLKTNFIIIVGSVFVTVLILIIIGAIRL